MIRNLFIFIFILPFYLNFAQINNGEDQEIDQELSEVDTVYEYEMDIMDTVQLASADIYHLNLKTDLEKKYYIWLRKRVRDVWPYVKIGVEEYYAIEDTAKSFKSNREKRKYVKKRKKILADQFETKLKDLTKSRGQILIKLIHRETDKTSYEIIKELRGGVNAFLWNSASGLYDLDLKTQFDPHATREDLYIEVILRRDFSSGRLEPIEHITK